VYLIELNHTHKQRTHHHHHLYPAVERRQAEVGVGVDNIVVAGCNLLGMIVEAVVGIPVIRKEVIVISISRAERAI
jgi:hypothetical protein